MSIPLTSAINTQINNKRIVMNYTFNINGEDRSDYLINWEVSTDRNFGSASANFRLNNTGGLFGDGGLYKINVGDVVELIETFEGDPTQFKRFYGIVEQRSIDKTAEGRQIQLTCLDYIAILQKTDIDADIEGTKVEVTEETLTPQYLPAPNSSLASIYNFANDALAQEPPPLIVIRPKEGTELVGETPQFDGFDVKYSQGQVVLGTPLNANDNYNVVATSYWFYTMGVFVEDVLETILTTPDGYGNYMFGEASAQAVIDNHLKTTFSALRTTTVDTLTPNSTTSNIIIRTTISSAVTAGATSIDVVSTSGFPTSGSATLNGDAFTWTGKTATTLTGIPSSGSNSLSAHPSGANVKYESTFAAGRVWYFTYSNITSTLSSSEFTGIPSGTTVDYIDYRYGRIILSQAISTSTIITHVGDYTMKTLQASGIELNRIKFNSREIPNRLEAINKLRSYVNPNYIVRTEGDNKIWASYLSQKVTADYTLKLAQQITYLEDEDLYTRVKFYVKNINPLNIMYNDGVQFASTGQTYKSTATQTELQYEKEDGNFWVYKTTITDAGRIDSSILKPTVYINNVPVNDHPQPISLMPVVVVVRQKTETETQYKRSGGADINVRQYFYYTIRFAHSAIDPSQPIVIYDAVGLAVLTISPYDSAMDYASGIYHAPGESQNTTLESASTASYTVYYSTSGIQIDVDTVRFKVSKQLVPSTDLALVAATFQYWTALTPFNDVGAIIDGRFDTQVQTEFFAEPPTGLQYAILDLGQVYTIQALDILAGFYKPDEFRKFNVDFKISLKYSSDNISYFSISPETQNVEFQGGTSKKFEEKDLGVDFQARYLRVDIEDVKRLDYRDGVWVVAFTEVSAYNNVVIKAEATLIPTTALTSSVVVSDLSSSGVYQTIVYVVSTAGFESPASGETATAYIGTDSFTYTGLTSDSFTGVMGLSSDHSIGSRVSQTLEDDTSMYDDDGLLPKLGDRLYKKVEVSDDILYTETQANALALAYLEEFYKNHSKIKTSVLYAPYLKVGDTVAVTDTYNDVSANYFIESISDKNGFYDLVLAKYPA